MPSAHPVYHEQNHFNERMGNPGERVLLAPEENDGSSGGIRALARQFPANGTNVLATERSVDRDPHYQSHYGQRPLPATPDNEIQRDRAPSQNGRHLNGGQYSPNTRGPSNELPQSNR